MIRTILAQMRISLLEMAAYRSNVVLWSIIDAIQPLAMVFVWLLVYQGQSTVAGLDQTQMLVYYIGVLIITCTVTIHSEWDIQDNIRSGNLKMHLTKPLPYAIREACESLAWRVNSAVFNIPIVFVLIWWLNTRFGLDAPYPVSWQFLLSLLGALGIFLSMSFALGFLAFFFERITGIIHANDVIRALASGYFLPLVLFPLWAQSILDWLPYRYQFAFPIEVLIGTVSTNEFWHGFLTQAAWTTLFTGLALLMWRIGIRRYDAPEQIGVAGVEA